MCIVLCRQVFCHLIIVRVIDGFARVLAKPHFCFLAQLGVEHYHDTAITKIDTNFLFIVCKTAPKQIVDIRRWQFVIKRFQTKGLACQKVKLAFLKQVFITASKAFLEDAWLQEYVQRHWVPHLCIVK